jgi:hypothetical protein
MNGIFFSFTKYIKKSYPMTRNELPHKRPVSSVNISFLVLSCGRGTTTGILKPKPPESHLSLNPEC